MNDIKTVPGLAVLDQNNVLYVLINNSRTEWPSDILMPSFEFLNQFASGSIFFSPKKW